MNSMFNKSRLIISAVAAPISLPIFFFLVNYIFSGPVAESEDYVGGLMSEAIFPILPLSYIFTFPLGLFVVMVLIKLKKMTAWYFVSFFSIAGLIIGFPFPRMIFESHSNNSSITSSFVYGLEFGIAGLVVSVIFCALAGLHFKARN